MRSLARAVAIAATLVGSAHADQIVGAAPTAIERSATRVVLADPDLELRHALATTLAPWKLEVIVDAPPDSEADGQSRAITHDAKFVVWRREGTLIVFDRERGEIGQHDGVRGALDGPSAAAAALTVKTLMRLPPPVDEVAVVDEPPVVVEPPRVERALAPSAAVAPRELRVQAGVSTRLVYGSEANLDTRFAGAVMVRPFGAIGLRVGVAGESGTTTTVEGSGFKGTWRDSSVTGIVAYGFDRGAWQVEPHVGAGVTWCRIEGLVMKDAVLRDSQQHAILRGGLDVRYRIGGFSIGANVDSVIVPATPTYMRDTGNNGNGMGGGNEVELFHVPGFGISVGLVTAFDFTL